MIFVHIFVFLALAFLHLPSVLNPALLHGFAYGDPEITAYIASLVGKGAKLYQDFAIVYGPGRFFALAGLNKLLGVSFSIPLLGSYNAFISLVLVPFCIYLATYSTLRSQKPILRFLISLCPMAFYSVFLRSGQDVHAVILLFVATYAWGKENKFVSFLAGFFLALVGFFRVEAGIIAFIAVVATEIISHKKNGSIFFLFGSYLFFQLCYFLLIVFHGSLAHFFHDIVQLGIIAQPLMMKIAIQPVDYPLFEFSLMMGVFAVLVAIAGEDQPLILLSFLSLLGFANALGRADFDHLYYGVVLIVPAATAAIAKLAFRWKAYSEEKISLKTFLFSLLFLILVIFIVKEQSTYLLLGSVFLFILCAKLLKKQNSIIAFFILIVTLCTLVRSQSLFIFYARRQFAIPPIKTLIVGYIQIPTFFREVGKGNYGGLQLNREDSHALEEMRQDLDGKTLFIYPSYVTLYSGLGKTPPIRYLYFNNEYTPQMEIETSQMLQNKKIEYILVSHNLTKPDAIVKNQTKEIAAYISRDYTRIKEYPFGGDQMILMERK